MQLELLHADAGDGEGDFEAGIGVHHFAERVECGEVGVFGYVADAALILVVIVVVVVCADVEEAVAFEMCNLVYLKI